MWEMCCAVCCVLGLGAGGKEQKKKTQKRGRSPGYPVSSLDFTKAALMGPNGGQRDRETPTVLVTVLIYRLSFSPKRECVWVGREAGQTGLG